MTIILIKGNEASLVSQAVQTETDALVGDGDRSLMVEEVTDEQYANGDGEPELTPLVNAAHTPPFLTDRRVVIGRHLAQFTKADQVAGLVEAIGQPLPTTDMILVWEKSMAAGANAKLGAIPKSLKEALKNAGAREIDAAPSGRGMKMLVDEKLADAPLRLDPSARRAIADNVGDKGGRVQALIETLVSAFGENAKLSASDVEPFLGQASDIPPWDLTDAIDNGDIQLSLANLRRMTQGGERHALQVLFTLHGHYQKALALDGAAVSNEKDAAALLGMKGSTFPAKKALSLSRSLGSARVAQAMRLVAAADLDVRGASAIPSETVMEVLVARLARLSR